MAALLVPVVLVYANQPSVLVGAGDIADCRSPGDEATAALLDSLAGAVFTTGDNAYDSGRTEEFQQCYAPTWGRHRNRTYPAAGNHDYYTRAGAPYYAYFGARAGLPGKGFYCYHLGTWHIVVLNSNLRGGAAVAQERWLRADLTAHHTPCTLAYWHHPLFSSGKHGNTSRMRALWQVLYEFGADVVLNGHDHHYERFAPQTPDGEPDPERGIREFIVGTGGAPLRAVRTKRANSEVRSHSTWGVLQLTLHPTSYDWHFIPVAGGTFQDIGSAPCVGVAPELN